MLSRTTAGGEEEQDGAAAKHCRRRRSRSKTETTSERNGAAVGADDLGKERNDDGEAQNQWRRGEKSGSGRSGQRLGLAG
jgi:hypothetical protein